MIGKEAVQVTNSRLPRCFLTYLNMAISLGFSK